MTIPPARMRAVWVFVWATSAVLVYAWLATTWLHRVSFDLPLRQIEIPLVWWLVWGTYVWAVRRVSRGLSAPLRALLGDALLLHLQWLLVDFAIQVDLHAWLGKIYVAWVSVALTVFVAATATRAGQLLKRVRVSCTPESAARVPFVVGTAAAVAVAAWHRESALALCVMGGLILGYHRDSRRLGDAARQLRERFQSPKAAVVALAAIMVVAFAFRVGWYIHLVGIVGYSHDTGFPAASDDGQTYDSISSELARDFSLLFSPRNPAVQTYFDPVYPIVISLWYRVFGIHFAPVVIAQSLLGTLVLIPLYRLACAFAGGSRAAGLVAAFVAALSPALIFSSVVYGIEALYVPVLALWVWLAAEWLEGRERAPKWLLMGIVGGLMLGLRRFAPLMLLGTLAVIVCAGARPPVGRRIRQAVAVLALAFVVYSPIELMYLQHGTQRLLPSQQSGEMSSMYWAAASKFPNIVPDNHALIEIGINPVDLPGTIRAVLSHPAAVAWALWHTIPKRMVAFFFWPAFGNFDALLLVNPTIPNPFTGTAEFYGAVAVLTGMVCVLRRGSPRRLAGLILVVIGVQTFVHSVLLFTHTSRYMTPIRPYLTALAAASLAWAWRLPREGDH